VGARRASSPVTRPSLTFPVRRVRFPPLVLQKINPDLPLIGATEKFVDAVLLVIREVLSGPGAKLVPLILTTSVVDSTSQSVVGVLSSHLDVVIDKGLGDARLH